MTVKRNILRKQQYPVTKWTCENVGREKNLTYLLVHLIFLQSFEIQRNSPWDLENLCWLVFSAPNDKKWSCKIKGKHKILDPFSIKVLSEITLEDQKYTMALLLPEVQNNCRHCTLLMLQQHAYYSPLNHYAMLLKDTRVDSLEWGGGRKMITCHICNYPRACILTNLANKSHVHKHKFTISLINNVIIFYSHSYKEKNWKVYITYFLPKTGKKLKEKGHCTVSLNQ